jgi:rhomboid protease GluP
MGQDLGFVQLIMVATIGLYLATLAGSGSDIGMGGLGNLLAPSPEMLFRFGASGAIPVFRFDRWWTIFSAGWLHGGLLHIFFNVLWIRQLGPAVGELYGAGRMVIIYTIAGVTGFLLSSLAGEFMGWLPIRILQGADLTVGASASIFGLLGAAVYYGRRTGSSIAASQAWNYALPLFIFGFILPGVDNYAHAGGFVGGYLTGLILDPLKPERVDHMVIALVCLVATVVALAASIITALPLLIAS